MRGAAAGVKPAISIWNRMFYPQNCALCTGTHDNDTTLGLYRTLNRQDKRFCREYLNLSGGRKKEVRWEFVRTAYAGTAIILHHSAPGFVRMKPTSKSFRRSWGIVI